MKTKYKAIIIFFASLLSALTIYPHSSLTKLLWLIGSFVAPGNNNSISGIVVFFGVFFVSVFSGIGFTFIINLIYNIYGKKNTH